VGIEDGNSLQRSHFIKYYHLPLQIDSPSQFPADGCFGLTGAGFNSSLGSERDDLPTRLAGHVIGPRRHQRPAAFDQLATVIRSLDSGTDLVGERRLDQVTA
jgi:hypothetical protein